MEPCLFTLNTSRTFAEKVAGKLGTALSEHEERDFVDGEHKARSLINVRGRDVYVIQSLYSDQQQSINDKLVRLLFFLGAMKDASAAKVTAVIPYLGYARKDRKTKARDPVTTRYMAAIVEAVGTDCVLTLDVHNLVAYQNAFRIQSEHLEATRLFAAYFSARVKDEEIIVVSPDVGGVKRSELFRLALQKKLGRSVYSGFMEKHRSEGVLSGDALVANVKKRQVIIVDDMIGSGATIARTVTACQQAGARRISAVASHGLFVDNAEKTLSDPALDELVITDTVPPFRLKSAGLKNKLIILDAASLFAEAIRRLHNDGSIVDLLEI